MFSKVRGSYLCFFFGVGLTMIIFTLTSHHEVVVKYYDSTAKVLKGKSFVNVTESSKRSKNSNLVECSDKVLEKRVQQRKNFVVFENFIVAERQFGCDESITLTAPGDYRFLDNIIPLVDRWDGPISVALYAPGYDFFTTLQCIAYLRICTSPLVRELVTFHLFFENDHMPETKGTPLLDAYEDIADCTESPPFDTKKDEDMYKEKNGLTYPINVARNVAKVTAQTYFVFPSDIELYPTRNFVEKFMNFISAHPSYIQQGTKNVFVLPIFEVLADEKVPENKTQLQYMFQRKKAILFHQNVCAQCHKVPDGDNWLKQEEGEGLEVFSVGKRRGKQTIWEPFFVCTQKEPLWDERLNWEGQGNKMCQAYAMCILDYDFMVLDNAFLIHKPGIKKKKVQVLKHMDQTRKNNKILVQIQKELQIIYGQKKDCKVHNVR